jgi:pSer/pThr/pTyr-binding forkhead associated (FHA) protein
MPAPANVSASTEPVVGKLTLSNENSKLDINISTAIGRSVLKRFGDDYKFYGENQFALEKTPDNQWKLIPNGTATNKTMINGRAVLSPILLTKGMRISVGNPEKKTEKLPLIVMSESVAENFKDGKNPQDKGDSKRLGVPTKASVTTLRRVAKQGGRKGQLAHWQANMKAGRAKKK